MEKVSIDMGKMVFNHEGFKNAGVVKSTRSIPMFDTKLEKMFNEFIETAGGRSDNDELHASMAKYWCSMYNYVITTIHLIHKLREGGSADIDKNEAADKLEKDMIRLCSTLHIDFDYVVASTK